jgi:transposase
MFVRKNPGRKGAVSVQIMEKVSGKMRVVRTIGTSSNPETIEILYRKAKAELHSGQLAIFPSIPDLSVESFLNSLSNSTITVAGPEIVFGKVFDRIGFREIDESIFRHLVVSRIIFPGSKLKTSEYLRLFHHVEVPEDQIYRFLDRLDQTLKPLVEGIVFNFSRTVLGEDFTSIFYDVTTLHFENEDEDDLRRLGYSKNGRHQNPQILLGLLVGGNGYPIAYEIFSGNTFEGHTFLPVLEAFTHRFEGRKPVVVADAGLLNRANIEALKSAGYEFILGGRIRNEPEEIKTRILHSVWKDGRIREFKRMDQNRLVVSYSSTRAGKDAHNRKRGLMRLEKAFRTGALTKDHINKKGYNRYLEMMGETQIRINYDAFTQDQVWDGLKGYITNSKMARKTLIAHYQQLFHIENAFRMSKTDLRIRPVFHRLESRIRAHICVAFCSYAVLKETERILKLAKANISLKQAALQCQTIYKLKTNLPDSKKEIDILLKMNEQQKILTEIFSAI